eukprot:1187837-Ditylum_brightwellii.AAC.1
MNVSITNLKNELENAKLDAFGHDIKEFNTWFTDKRNAIIREVGKEGYTKCKRCLFKTYHTTENKEFLMAISQEKRDWIMEMQKTDVQQPEVPWRAENQECSGKEKDQGGHKVSGPLDLDGEMGRACPWKRTAPGGIRTQLCPGPTSQRPPSRPHLLTYT